jgi:outer membrane immunogenic protein
MQKIKVLAALGAALLAGSILASPAIADGMPAKKAKAAPAKAHVEERPHIGNWGGLYFGANVGVALWDTEWKDPYNNPPYANHSNDDANGFIGGHIGIQHQFGRIVVGVEASYSGTGPFGHDWQGKDCVYGAPPPMVCQDRVNSLFTVGPRLGLAHDHLLFYVTGGFASATFSSRVYYPNTNSEYAYSARHDGWFIGGGVEWAIHDRWVLGLEYLHADFDKEAHDYDRHVDGDIDVIRARLSFKLGRKEHVEALK